MKTRISLIVTTYNRPEHLRACLLSVLRQKELPLEIIIADDGSLPQTAETIIEFSDLCPIPVVHCWQEDIGFRLSASRNRAIAAASGEYIVIVDGDMILEQHFIADHQRLAQPGRFVQGRFINMGSSWNRTALGEGKTVRPRWWHRDLNRRLGTIHNSTLAWLRSHPFRPGNSGAGGNQGFWREDLIRVNGFDENFTGWGHEDLEILHRLQNIGVTGWVARHEAIIFHVDHPISSKGQSEKNLQLVAYTIESKRIWCDQGISQYLKEKPGKAA